MGPRSADRGIGKVFGKPPPSSKLQWGRDPLIAELISGEALPFRAGKLQWGRDPLIAELAAPLFYSVFKDLHARQRAPHHFTPKSPFRPNLPRP
jgi:hypothetical protein